MDRRARSDCADGPRQGSLAKLELWECNRSWPGPAGMMHRFDWPKDLHSLLSVGDATVARLRLEHDIDESCAPTFDMCYEHKFGLASQEVVPTRLSAGHFSGSRSLSRLQSPCVRFHTATLSPSTHLPEQLQKHLHPHIACKAAATGQDTSPVFCRVRSRNGDLFFCLVHCRVLGVARLGRVLEPSRSANLSSA